MFLFLPLIIISILLILETRHFLRPRSPIKKKVFGWECDNKSSNLSVSGWVELSNVHKLMEVMITDFDVKTTMVGMKRGNYYSINKKEIIPYFPDEVTREDDYWSVYIIKSKSSFKIKIDLSFQSKEEENIFQDVESIWISLEWFDYGPFGKIKRNESFLVPISHPQNQENSKNSYSECGSYKLIPINTHMLGILDDPIDVINMYTNSIIKAGDLVTIGETPLAIIQGRYHLADSLTVGFLARLLCRSFHPTSSLATAYGMQTLIDIIGPSRILLAWFCGSFLKVFGIKGCFYRIAGKQARLIDDLTGTTPPYDKTIVLGPKNVQSFCNQASKKLGISIAVVDVNDLGKVKILASSKLCRDNDLTTALRSNPAGNANQHTPIVIIRPINKPIRM